MGHRRHYFANRFVFERGVLRLKSFSFASLNHSSSAYEGASSFIMPVIQLTVKRVLYAASSLLLLNSVVWAILSFNRFHERFLLNSGGCFWLEPKTLEEPCDFCLVVNFYAIAFPFPLSENALGFSLLAGSGFFVQRLFVRVPQEN